MKLMVIYSKTGGHTIPAVEIAKAGRMRFDEITLVGPQKTIGSEIVEKAGFTPITTEFDGNPKKIFSALGEAYDILRKKSPDALISMGAYNSVPFVVVNRFLKNKIFFHEQNHAPGKANFWLDMFGFFTKGFVAYEETAHLFKAPCSAYGNPINLEYVCCSSVSDSPTKQKKKILVMPGSQGSKDILKSMIEYIKYNKKSGEYDFVLVTGKPNYAEVKAEQKKFGLDVKVIAYLDNPKSEYADTDLFIGRAGAITVAELDCQGIPSILIPYPHANNHQIKNTVLLENCAVIEQSKLTIDLLAEEIDLLMSVGRRPAKIKKYENIARRIIEDIYETINN